MHHKVFLRFCTADKAVAETLRENLEKRGFQVWAPPIDMSSAIRWNEQIAEAIDEAEVALLVFSSRLGLSPQLERELRRARANGARLVIVSVEDAPLPNGFRDLVEDRDWLAAWEPPFEAHLDRIAEAIGPVAAPVDAAERSGEHLEEIHEEIYLIDPPDFSARKIVGGGSVNRPKSIRRAIVIGAGGAVFLSILALLYAAFAHFTSPPSSPAARAVTGPSEERLVEQQSGAVAPLKIVKRRGSKHLRSLSSKPRIRTAIRASKWMSPRIPCRGWPRKSKPSVLSTRFRLRLRLRSQSRNATSWRRAQMTRTGWPTSPAWNFHGLTRIAP